MMRRKCLTGCREIYKDYVMREACTRAVAEETRLQTQIEGSFLNKSIMSLVKKKMLLKRNDVVQ